MNALTMKTEQSLDTLLEERGQRLEESPFRDTANRSVAAAYALGIVSGRGDGRFDPDGRITRQEAAVIVMRAAKTLGKSLPGGNAAFADLHQAADWAKEAIRFVTAAKDRTNGKSIMGDTGGNRFSPQGVYSRQQAMITVKRLFHSL